MDNLKIATHFMVSDGVFEQHALYLTETENGKFIVSKHEFTKMYFISLLYSRDFIENNKNYSIIG